jgi:hypothetical protein
LELREYDYLIPLHESYTTGISGGMLEFEIYDFDIMVNPTASTTPDYTEIKESVIDVRIKDIVISIVDADGEEISTDDVEYVGYMNSKYKDEGEEITTLQGTSKTDNSIEKAALIGLNSTGSYFYLKD